MQTKFNFAAVLIILLTFIIPLNTIAQREKQNKGTDRIQLKPMDKTPPKEREKIVNPPDRKPSFIDVKKERPKERPKDPPFLPRKNERKPPVTITPVEYPEPEVDVYVEEIIYWEVLFPPAPPIVEPHFIKPNYKLEGIQKYKDGDYYAAFNDLNIAIEKDTNDYELYSYRGLVELKIKFFEEAKDDFTKYLEYFFYEPDGYFQRGLAEFYLNEKAEAREDFQIAADMGHKLAISILKRFY